MPTRRETMKLLGASAALSMMPVVAARASDEELQQRYLAWLRLEGKMLAMHLGQWNPRTRRVCYLADSFVDDFYGFGRGPVIATTATRAVPVLGALGISLTRDPDFADHFKTN